MMSSSPRRHPDLLVVILLVMLTQAVGAQIQNQTWPETGKMIPIPDSLMNEDAVMVDYFQKLEYGYLASYFTEKRRIRILSAAARDQYSSLTVTALEGVEVVRHLDARTIKPDGRIITIQRTDILKKEQDLNGDGKSDLITYSVPVAGVEVGDEVVTFLTKRVRHYPDFRFTRFAYGATGGRDYTDDGSFSESSLFNVFLHSELYCLHSELLVQASPEFMISYNCYNGLAKPEIERDSAKLLLKCSMEMLPPLRDRNFTCMYCEVPYISFYVQPANAFMNFNPGPRNWKDLYQVCDYEFNPDDASYWNKHNYFFSFYERQIKPLADSGGLYQFRKFYNYIRDYVDIRPVHPAEEEYNIGFFLSNKYMDKRNLMKTYRKMLDYLNLPYYYCFVRPVNKGPFDMGFFREGEVSDVFLAFRDEKDNFHIIQPQVYYGNKFELDEVSPEYGGTTAVLVRQEDTLKVRMMTIPGHPCTENTSSIAGKVTIATGDSLWHMRAKATLSGDFSTTGRQFWQLADSLLRMPRGRTLQEAVLVKEAGVDSIHLDSYSSSYPYLFRFSFRSQIRNRTRLIGSSEYTLPVEEILQPFEVTVPSVKRWQGLYFPFAYTKTYRMMLNFDHPAEVLNAEMFNHNEDNETVSLTSSLSRLNDHAYLLTVSFALKKAVVRPEAFQSLASAKKSLEQLQNLMLLYRLAE